MSAVALFDAEPIRRDVPWGTIASVGLHVGLALALILVSPLRQLVVPPPAPVSVEIVTEAQFAAIETPAPPVLATPTPTLAPEAAPEVAPAAPGEARLAPSPPLTPQAKQNPTIKATEFYASRILMEPGMARIRSGLQRFAGSERVVQLCNIEGLEQIRRAARQYDPDTLVSYAMADPVAAGLTLSASGGAFRSRRKWYGIAFDCTVGADLESVTAFSFRLGDPIPEDQWEDHNLNAADADE
ncbi:MAG: DUF930 domain-containing protein [Devosia sp.]